MPYDRPDRSSAILSSSVRIEASGQLNREFQVVADLLDGLFSRHALGRESHRLGEVGADLLQLLGGQPEGRAGLAAIGWAVLGEIVEPMGQLDRLAPLEPRPGTTNSLPTISPVTA